MNMTLAKEDLQRLASWGAVLMSKGLFTPKDDATYRRLNNVLVELLEAEDKVSLRTAPDS